MREVAQFVNQTCMSPAASNSSSPYALKHNNNNTHHTLSSYTANSHTKASDRAPDQVQQNSAQFNNYLRRSSPTFNTSSLPTSEDSNNTQPSYSINPRSDMAPSMAPKQINQNIAQSADNSLLSIVKAILGSDWCLIEWFLRVRKIFVKSKDWRSFGLSTSNYFTPPANSAKCSLLHSYSPGDYATILNNPTVKSEIHELINSIIYRAYSLNLLQRPIIAAMHLILVACCTAEFGPAGTSAALAEQTKSITYSELTRVSEFIMDLEPNSAHQLTQNEFATICIFDIFNECRKALYNPALKFPNQSSTYNNVRKVLFKPSAPINTASITPSAVQSIESKMQKIDTDFSIKATPTPAKYIQTLATINTNTNPTIANATASLYPTKNSLAPELGLLTSTLAPIQKLHQKQALKLVEQSNICSSDKTTLFTSSTSSNTAQTISQAEQNINYNIQEIPTNFNTKTSKITAVITQIPATINTNTNPTIANATASLYPTKNSLAPELGLLTSTLAPQLVLLALTVVNTALFHTNMLAISSIILNAPLHLVQVNRLIIHFEPP